jgi:RNA polymerase sigma factor (sigma-70 family)
MQHTDSVKDYLNAIARYPLLTPEQEIQLARQVEAGKAFETKEPVTLEDKRVVRLAKRAKDKLINSNLRLVVFIAKKYTNRLNGHSMELMDIVQEGAFGLMRAVELYDSTKGYKFSTYAYWWVRQAITRGINTRERLIRLPQHGVELLHKITKFQREYAQRHKRAPSMEEVAKNMDIEMDYLQALLQRNTDPRSLDGVVMEGGSCLLDLLEDESSAEEQRIAVESDEARTMLEFAFDALTDDEATVMRKRYGLNGDGEDPVTFAVIAKELGVSRERVRQRVQIAHTKMRLRLKAARFV